VVEKVVYAVAELIIVSEGIDCVKVNLSNEVVELACRYVLNALDENVTLLGAGDTVVLSMLEV